MTNAPEQPRFAEDTFNSINRVTLDELEAGRKLVINIEPNIENDELIVTWKLYKGTNNEEDDFPIISETLVNKYTASFNPLDYVHKIKDVNEDLDGRYYATVYTKLNGELSEPTLRPDVEFMFDVETE